MWLTSHRTVKSAMVSLPLSYQPVHVIGQRVRCLVLTITHHVHTIEEKAVAKRNVLVS